ncbi:ABC transporter substrate-binding protein [Pusillimonas sp.]|uniref:ABC transporter substrate-binding protein n=1 Tax=Pusillimonas sp. TaxID=3040095 RepID=UPI0029B07D38|nr:extracellular solute-binding protein [Pusillimonas sp.]MDX3895116.1 extracellular solute-binding protein [Pusillimonas sp.]
MFKSRFKSCLATVIALAGIGLAAQAAAQQATLAELAALQDGARQQSLIEGAKKEGELTVYFAHPSIRAIAAAFTEKYGIKVNQWRSGSESILQRVMSESRGGKYSVDLIENNAPEMEALHRESLLQRMESPLAGHLMPEAVPAHKEWVGISIDMFVLGYNTQKIKREELPATWQDLLDPKWKGMLGVEAEDHAWFAYVLQQLGKEEGSALFRKMVATNGIVVRKGHSLLAQTVASGETPLAFSLYSWGADQLKDKGAPIERFNIGQPIAHLQGLGVMKEAPHPHAAVLFYDFVLSDGQKIISDWHAIATHKDYDQDQKKAPIQFIDPATAMDLNEARLRVFEDIFVKRSAR